MDSFEEKKVWGSGDQEEPRSTTVPSSTDLFPPSALSESLLSKDRATDVTADAQEVAVVEDVAVADSVALSMPLRRRSSIEIVATHTYTFSMALLVRVIIFCFVFEVFCMTWYVSGVYQMYSRLILLNADLKVEAGENAAAFSDDPETLVQLMTTEEKKSMLAGIWHYGQYSGIVPGVPRLGIPPLLMNDGPQGFNVFPQILCASTLFALVFYPVTGLVDAAFGTDMSLTDSVRWLVDAAFAHVLDFLLQNRLLPDRVVQALTIVTRDGRARNVVCGNAGADPCNRIGSTTAFPASLSISAAFSEETARSVYAAMGAEFVGKGANMILGPALNMHRVPYGSRNFEYLPGEDPVLGAAMASAIVETLSDPGGPNLMVVIKHWLGNEQEKHTSAALDSSYEDGREMPFTLWEKV